MPQFGQPVYVLDRCEIDLRRREIRVGGVPAAIGGKAFDIIDLLVRSEGDLVTKDELLAKVWPGTFVSESTLRVHFASVRRALGPYRKWFKKESGLGYRLSGQWTLVEESGAEVEGHSATPASPLQTQLNRNFPLDSASLVGRLEAEKLLSDLLSAFRLVTLTGTGGIGKTSLALKVAGAILHSFDDGGWLVELAPISDLNLVPSTVTSVLGLKLGGGELSAEVVAQAIGDKNILLVLDNCEHVIAEAGRLAESIIRLCPNVTVLATSREALRVSGENVFRVPPLDVPGSLEAKSDEILRNNAIELFLVRMRSQNPTFLPDATEVAAIARICRHLDGIPLAIEFAAARASTLGLARTSEMLDDRFSLLSSRRRTALPRHRTLRATLDWSYRLLSDKERLLLRHLSIFPGGFTADAAAALVSDFAFDQASVREGIVNLVSKSLVAFANSIVDERWYLLETIRAFAFGELVRHGEHAGAANNHALYFQKLLIGNEQQFGSHFSDAEWTRRLREIDNVRSAIEWSFSTIETRMIGVRLTAAYAPVWLDQSLMPECRHRCEQALGNIDLASPSDAESEMWLQVGLAASLFDTMGDAKRAQSLLTAALRIAETRDHLTAQAAVLASLVSNYFFQSEYGKARSAAERLGLVAKKIGDPTIVGIADRQMGTVLLMLGRISEAQQLFIKFLVGTPQMAQERLPWHPANHRATARALLARVLWLKGLLNESFQEAKASVDEELLPVSHQLLVCRVLYFGLCRVALYAGDFDVTERSISRLVEVARRMNAPFWQTAGRLLSGALMIERGQFEEGVDSLRSTLSICHRTGWRLSYREFTTYLARGLAGLGRLDEAIEVIDEVLVASHGLVERDLFFAEAVRLKGEVLLTQGLVVDAEKCFLRALEIAREQEALFWELRVAVSLTKLRSAQRSSEDTFQSLSALCNRFEGSYTAPDLVAARGLLDTLR